MIAEIRAQFDLAWALCDLHLAEIDDTSALWEPSPVCWTVRRDDTGVWRADWATVEPEPVPVPTIAWLAWHIAYWWTATLAAMSDEPMPDPVALPWAGDAESAVATLRGLAQRWRQFLHESTVDSLAAPSTFPWGPGTSRTQADTALWVAVELTKNAAEIGTLRLLHATS